MIGFYDYTVVLTYGGLLCALFGMFAISEGALFPALLWQGACLICDTMDGRVARAKKNRTHQEKLFGMQIDSLCDTVSFGIFPAVLCWNLGLKDGLSLVILCYYCLCCVIRLGYFNVMELVREEGTKSIYHGLPVVGFAVLLPCLCMTSLWLPDAAFLWVLRGALALVGTLYILDFKVQKPRVWMLCILGTFFLIPMVILGILG